ncbi:hypothetical protein PMZ80_009474 [Knufia obscura]|uniref:Linoleate 8R-lipoxygenase n=2 Tax=Knufia TaxID=430999 RepID=A0AAN8EPY8_9EURO|nr:hypothetical protein PMZ80_009474 [Knufia obscura]KAK5949588.1 hypothetical protein OHC33_009395 [Knufia fluminis]
MSKRKADEAELTQNGVRPSPQAIKEREGVSQFLKGLFEKVAGRAPDPTYPVINGATAPPKPVLKDLIADVASQSGRWLSDVGLIGSLADTKLLDGGMVDDRKYQMESIIQLAASLPEGSDALNGLSHAFIKLLWENLQHPPLSVLGDQYKYRQADGSHNNLLYPNLGKAGQPYARTIKPSTLKQGVLPDPEVLFDALMARGKEPKDHPNKISSMLFYVASIIIHDIFHTDESDYSKVKTSSYLDLAPLYGNNQQEQNRVRLHKDGLLKPDTFSNIRILGFPPGVGALLICFNRYHNYVAMQLKEINEGGRFTPDPKDKGHKKLDEDLFQTARHITCGLYVNIILTDYVRTILNLNRTNSTWTLDPRDNFGIFDSTGTAAGCGNQVSCEFNLVYRWHSAISKRDEKWSEAMYEKITDTKDYNKIDQQEFVDKLHAWVRKKGNDPAKWSLDNLDETLYPRNENGTFDDADLCQILTESTEDVAAAFGPRQVPIVMKLIEVMGMKQARSWNVATLNEFRRFFKLEPHKTFNDITRDEEVAHALEALYQHPDYVELYPGIVVEDAKDAYEPGSGLCPGYTISRTILADAVALVRGDRFYTIDFTPATLTNWGFNQIKPDPEVAQGCSMYNLIMRALPNWYRGNSVYAMYPLTVPKENEKILEKLGKKDLYDFARPSYIPVPTPVKSWAGVTSVLSNQKDFRVPWGPHTSYLTGHDYMLSGDKPANAQQRAEINNALFCPVGWKNEIRKFYEALTTQLVEIKSEKLRGKWYQLDACRDVGNPSHAVFVAQMFSIPLKGPNSLNPAAVEVDQLYLAFSVLFAYVFLDADTARSFKLRAGAKTANDQLTKLIKLVVTEIQVGSYMHLNGLFALGQSGKLLRDYGVKLIERMLETEDSIEATVAAIIPTAAAAVGTQAQHFAQMLDLYLSPEYNSHWPSIQRLAWSDSDEDFELLKSYALEANRIRPAAWGLLRRTANATTINDGKCGKIKVSENEQIYTDFVSAGLDPKVFPDPHSIKLDRPRDRYIHHGYGAHACLGRPMVEIAMASQLKVFARLKNLRPAPGPQGQMKRTIPPPNPVSSDPHENPGSITVYMKEDWSDWWPFPTQLKVHHEGFFESQEEMLGLGTGLPDVGSEIVKSRVENGDVNGLGPDKEGWVEEGESE